MIIDKPTLPFDVMDYGRRLESIRMKYIMNKNTLCQMLGIHHFTYLQIYRDPAVLTTKTRSKIKLFVDKYEALEKEALRQNISDIYGD